MYCTSKDGSKIYYELEGEGKITLCWVYGGGGMIEYWKLQRPLSEKYKMLYIELAGHGKSISQRENYTMEAFGEDVAAVVRKENLQVILVGWSMGGSVILEAAKILGNSALGLIGIDTFFPLPGSIYIKNDPKSKEILLEPFKYDTAQRILDLYDYHMNNGIGVKEEHQRYFKELGTISATVFLSELGELILWDVLPFLTNPSHTITAIMAGLSVPLEQRSLFKKHNIAAVFMEMHGHCLHMADPNTFASLLNERIDKIMN